MAPFSNVAPSVGWSTVSVGASMTRNGTVMNRRERLLGALAGVRIERS